MARPGNTDIQLDLFLDYANDVKLYPAFHEYFRKWTPPLLAIWGRTTLTSSRLERKPSNATTRMRLSNFSTRDTLR